MQHVVYLFPMSSNSGAKEMPKHGTAAQRLGHAEGYRSLIHPFRTETRVRLVANSEQRWRTFRF